VLGTLDEFVALGREQYDNAGDVVELREQVEQAARAIGLSR
jgi:hypothetical protein